MTSPLPWLRLWDSVLDDPKVQRLPDRLFRHWVNLLCLANRGSERGQLPPTAADVAFALRISEEEANDALQELTKRELIEWTPAGSPMPHNWGGRQFKSDNVSERVTKHRKGNVTRNVSEGANGNVIEQSRTEQIQSRRPPPTPSANGRHPSRYAAAVGEDRFQEIASNFSDASPQLTAGWLDGAIARIEASYSGFESAEVERALATTAAMTVDAFSRPNSIKHPRRWAETILAEAAAEVRSKTA